MMGVDTPETFRGGQNIQCVPLATEPGIYLIILTPMKILQRIRSLC